MFTVKKNDPAFKELTTFADTKNKPLKEVLLADEYLDDVSQIFYKHMPKMVRWSMKEEKFKEFYRTHREQLVAHIG